MIKKIISICVLTMLPFVVFSSTTAAKLSFLTGMSNLSLGKNMSITYTMLGNEKSAVGDVLIMHDRASRAVIKDVAKTIAGKGLICKFVQSYADNHININTIVVQVIAPSSLDIYMQVFKVGACFTPISEGFLVKHKGV